MSADIFDNLTTSSVFELSSFEDGSAVLDFGVLVTEFVEPLAKALGGISDLIGLIN
ncbi:hypothetical protein [Corynebacterium doosanense]|uniref:hypothetical protein n=1 Tax=Corynebacterium doosanense TaxID=1121358 RepID=UPI000374A92C|nr:hypothetical protein [Corynebacterium doosanense]